MQSKALADYKSFKAWLAFKGLFNYFLLCTRARQEETPRGAIIEMQATLSDAEHPSHPNTSSSSFLIIAHLIDSLEEPDSMMSKLFTSTWANFVKEVIIGKKMVMVIIMNTFDEFDNH